LNDIVVTLSDSAAPKPIEKLIFIWFLAAKETSCSELTLKKAK
jgi:hypothetical protein